MPTSATRTNFRNTAAASARAMVASKGGSPAQQQTSANAAAAAADLMSAADAPSDEAASQLQSIAQNHPIAFSAAVALMVSGAYAKWEGGGGDGALNPIGGIKRRKPFPVKILPGMVALLNGAGSLTFAPQEEFEAFRLCVPSGQPSLPAFITQLQAGDRNMQAQSGRIPAACLSELTDLGRIDFPILKLAQTISMQIVGGVNVGTPEFCAVLLGYARGRNRVLPDGAEILGERLEPFDVTVVPANGVAELKLQPQRNIILRRIGLDDTVANFASMYITYINVQDNPQFTSNVEIPAKLFSELAQDDWLDFDMCALGGLITIGLRNANAAPVTVQGVAVADLVKLAGEGR